MPPVTHPRRPAGPDRRLTIAPTQDTAPEAGPVAADQRQDIPHDQEDPVLRAVAEGAPPRTLIRAVQHQIARDAAAIEFLIANPDVYPGYIQVEFARLAGRRQRTLRGLVTSALRDLDAEREEADVPAEIFDRLRALFTAKVLEAAQAVCTPEDAARFEARLLEKMSG